MVEDVIYDFDHQDVIVAKVGLNKQLHLPKGSSAEISSDLLGGDGLADNITWRSKTSSIYMMATGSPQMNSYNFSALYDRDYKAIYYCNLFLKDNLGKNTRYMLDANANAKLQRALQGDAFGLRAFYYWDLLKFFGGRSVSGEMLGVPIFTEPVDLSKSDLSKVTRASYADCVQQILADCDSAYKYLPLANRDFLKDPEMIPAQSSERIPPLMQRKAR